MLRKLIKAFECKEQYKEPEEFIEKESREETAHKVA